MTQVNIHEPQTGRQANNVSVSAIADAIGPWFADIAGCQKVREAIIALQDEQRRDEAMRYLGIVLSPAT
ncbi:MAG: hypothetical protein Q4P66_05800 [Actinomycetaceae bacterium]|nr:hypothetical protein [Actinomycetaceae bacterium]